MAPDKNPHMWDKGRSRKGLRGRVSKPFCNYNMNIFFLRAKNLFGELMMMIVANDDDDDDDE